MVRLDLIWAGVELVYDTGILVKKEEGRQHYYLIRGTERRRYDLDVVAEAAICTSSTAINNYKCTIKNLLMYGFLLHQRETRRWK